MPNEVAGCGRRPVMALFSSLGVLASLATVVPCAAVAQEGGADTLPFRRGQWAAQFRLPGDAAGLGVLRFRSASSAWVLDATLTVHQQKTTTSDGSGSGASLSGYSAVRAGIRTYRPLFARVAGYSTVGMTTGVDGYESRPASNAIPDQRMWQLRGGPYADVGAVYLVTPHLTLGASTQAAIGLSHARQHYSATATQVARESRSSGWFAYLGGVSILATLFF